MRYGDALENTIMELFKRYEQLGIHCQQNFMKRTETGIRIAKHGFDFQVFHNGVFYAFDAKECTKTRWSFNPNAKLHQLNALCCVEKNKGQGFFLIHYYNKGLLRVPATIIKEMMKNGEKSLQYDDKFKTKLDFLGVLDEPNRRN